MLQWRNWRLKYDCAQDRASKLYPDLADHKNLTLGIWHGAPPQIWLFSPVFTAFVPTYLGSVYQFIMIKQEQWRRADLCHSRQHLHNTCEWVPRMWKFREKFWKLPHQVIWLKWRIIGPLVLSTWLPKWCSLPCSKLTSLVKLSWRPHRWMTGPGFVPRRVQLWIKNYLVGWSAVGPRQRSTTSGGLTKFKRGLPRQKIHLW